MSELPVEPELIVTFSDGAIAVWHEGNFSGDEDKVALAIIRSDVALSWEFEDGIVTANSYSAQGAAIAIVGGTDFSEVSISGSTKFFMSSTVITASIGAWH